MSGSIRKPVVSRHLHAALIIGLALILLGTNGDVGCSPGTFYVLDEDAAFLEGCIDGPCLCPVSAAPLRGYFWLVPLPVAAPFDVYEMRNVHWQVLQGERARTITGSGFYSVAGLQHGLQMELAVDDDAGETYTSGGFVPGAERFPDEIVIRISTGPVCYGRVIELHARALSAP